VKDCNKTPRITGVILIRVVLVPLLLEVGIEIWLVTLVVGKVTSSVTIQMQKLCYLSKRPLSMRPRMMLIHLMGKMMI
jgi:hypothetical protein